MQYFLKIKEKLFNKNIIFLSIILLYMLILPSCSSDSSNENMESDSQEEVIQIYYIDVTQTSLVGMDYIPESDSPSDLIGELITTLSQNIEGSSIKKSKPDSMLIKEYELSQNGRLVLDFNIEYNEFKGIEEVLYRATVVKTLLQIDGVNYIEFTVNGQPLLDSKGKVVGYMDKNSFINTTYAEDVYVTIYFSNNDGSSLVPSNLRMTYDGNIPIVELIVNRLIAGPVERYMLSTIPESTKLNSITVKDGICYVDFNEGFLNINPTIDPEIVIYSIVNSLVELSYVNRVQFTINGTMVKEYNGITFNKPFERKLEIVEASS